MRYQTRAITEKLTHISELYPVVLLTGARQTGKTELARHCFPGHRWTLLDQSALVTQAREDPTLFIQNNPPPVIFDEVQRVPELFLELKAVVDRTELAPGSIVLTGSQPLQLMKSVSDSLAGRVGIVELLPMSPAEIFELSNPVGSFEQLLSAPPIGQMYAWNRAPDELVFRGGFPAMTLEEHSPTEADSAQRLSDYIQTYLHRDLRDLSNIQDLGRFEKFLRVLAADSAHILNISESARDAQIPQTTAQDWISLLEASNLVYQLPAYSKNLGKRETKRPKLILADSGLQLNLLGYNSSAQVVQSPVIGASFETAVANSVRSLLAKTLPQPKMYHWRFAETQEVDIVIETSFGVVHPVEIKRTAKPSKKDITGIEAFRKRIGSEELGLVISTSEHCFWLDKRILHIPWSML